MNKFVLAAPRVLKEPLVHFLLAGVVLFCGYTWIIRTAENPLTRETAAPNKRRQLQGEGGTCWRQHLFNSLGASAFPGSVRVGFFFNARQSRLRWTSNHYSFWDAAASARRRV